MVGIKVGGTYSGLGVGSIVAVSLGEGVRVGNGVFVSVAVFVGGGTEGVTCDTCPQAVTNRHNAIIKVILVEFFMTIHLISLQ